MKKILITGSTGKIGKYLSNSLKENYTIYTISRLQSTNYNFYYDFDKQYGDLSLLQEIEFDAVIHCIGILPSSKSSKKSYYNVNSESINILASYINNTCKFIFLGTISVYGESITEKIINEIDLLNPKNTYAKSKLLGETFTKKNFLNYYIFRIPPVYLNMEDKTIYKRLIKNKFIEIKFGDDSQSHSYCSLEKLVYVTKRFIEQNIDNGIYHVADQKTFNSKFLKQKIKVNSLITIKVNKKYCFLLVRVFNFMKLKFLENKINEIYFKIFCDNVYSTKKVYRAFKKY